jgi:hypothetical protein
VPSPALLIDQKLHGYDERVMQRKSNGYRETRLTRETMQQTLRDIKDHASEALRLLDSGPLTVQGQSRVKTLVQELQQQLRSEYDRLGSAVTQKTLFESSVYSPRIGDLWTKSGIATLDVATGPDCSWHVALKSAALLA